jgi:hypothetical protein
MNTFSPRVFAAAAAAAAADVSVAAPGSKVGELDQRSLDALAGMPYKRALSALDR